MAIALDTLAYARRLREAGFTEAQAEGQAQALAAAMTDTLATKQDLDALEVRTNAEFAAVRHEIRELDVRMQAGFAQVDTRFSEQAALFQGQLAQLEQRMTIRLGTVTVAAVGAFSAIIKLL